MTASELGGVTDALSALLPRIDATFVGLREVEERTTTFHVRDELPEEASVRTSRGVMVEVMSDGGLGYAATGARSLEGIARAAETARERARAVARCSVVRATPALRPGARVDDARGAGARPLERPADVLDALVALSGTMRLEGVVRRTATVRVVEMTTRIASTEGAEVRLALLATSLDLSATCEREGVVQRRSAGGAFADSRQAGVDGLFGAALRERARLVAEQARELVAAPECPTETTTVVLAPDQMMLQIHESIGHPLELDRILGDERNYAGGSFVTLSDVGTLDYGSPLLTVSWDPTLPGEFAGYAADDAGDVARRELIIDRGRLVRLLGGVESRARARIAGVATQRASSWSRPPIDRMANLNVEPGELSRDALLGGVESGIYMEANRSWSIDDRRDNFQFGCEYGRLVRGGRLGAVVRNPGYRGRALSFWRSLSAVGNLQTREAYGTPYCGKGEPNQVIRVGHASPICRFDGVEVFGGAP